MKKGFTLIELLVVIAVIGLLASIVLVPFGPARGKARDAKRYSDFTQLQKALELYYDQQERYPATPGENWSTVCNKVPPQSFCNYNSDVMGPNGWIPSIAPTYVGILPVDPLGCNTGGCGGYIYKSNGIDYKIAMDWSAEIGTECGVGKRFYDSRCGSSNPCTFCSLSTPGAVNW